MQTGLKVNFVNCIQERVTSVYYDYYYVSTVQEYCGSWLKLIASQTLSTEEKNISIKNLLFW